MEGKQQFQAPRVEIGRGGLEISKMGFGCSGLSGIFNDPLPDEQGVPLIIDAFNKGVTFFDTAGAYANGDNEVLIGKALKHLPREKAHIASKLGIVGVENGNYPKCKGKKIKSSSNIAEKSSDEFVSGHLLTVTDEENSGGYISTRVLEIDAVCFGSEWILDSGCCYHMCADKKFFDTYISIDGGRVLMGNNAACRVIGMGTIQIKMFDGSVMQLTDVRHVPKLKKNLISLGTLDSNGYGFKCRDGVIKVFRGNLDVMRGIKQNGLYFLEGNTIIGSTKQESLIAMLWHMRLGHISERELIELSKRGLLHGQQIKKLDVCKHCEVNKQCRVKFDIGVHRSKETVEYIHSDLWGPKVTSKSGFRYMLTFVDDYSRMVWVYFLKHRNDVFEKFKFWKIMIEEQTRKPIKHLMIDNEPIFCSDKFRQFYRKHKITIQCTPQQNGIAKQMNRTLMKRTQYMLSNAGLGEEFWTEACNTAAFLINKSPSTSIECMIPEEKWSGSSTNYNYADLKIFGCPAYTNVRESKLKLQAKKYIFLGYADEVKKYNLWYRDYMSSKDFTDVTFDEYDMFKKQE